LTPEGLLDEVWEGQPSQLSVAAQALYDAPDELPERQIIQYTLVEPFRTMPAGLLLDRDTGMILGTMPRVSADQTFAFSVEARVVFLDQLGTRRVSEISQTRTFRVKVRRFYDHPGAIDILVPASGQLTNYLTRWIWGDGRSSDATPVIKDSEVWRVRDPQAGRSSEFHLALVSGLLDLTDEALAVKLRDYHGGGSLRPATLGSRKVLDGLGRHTHDAVFMTLTDPLEGAGGFRDGLEVLVDRYEPNQAAQALPQWNLQAADRHLFPASLENARRDLIQTEERLAWTENLESADQRGVGLSGPSESWPRWMMGQWRCEILLLHAQPNLGPTLVGRLERAGLMSQLPSQTMSRTRYLVRRRQHQQTTWDGGLTTWDGPTSVDSPTASQTVFDETTLTDDKYQRV
jgi:hypothetical protein